MSDEGVLSGAGEDGAPAGPLAGSDATGAPVEGAGAAGADAGGDAGEGPREPTDHYGLAGDAAYAAALKEGKSVREATDIALKAAKAAQDAADAKAKADADAEADAKADAKAEAAKAADVPPAPPVLAMLSLSLEEAELLDIEAASAELCAVAVGVLGNPRDAVVAANDRWLELRKQREEFIESIDTEIAEAAMVRDAAALREQRLAPKVRALVKKAAGPGSVEDPCAAMTLTQTWRYLAKKMGIGYADAQDLAKRRYPGKVDEHNAAQRAAGEAMNMPVSEGSMVKHVEGVGVAGAAGAAAA